MFLGGGVFLFLVVLFAVGFVLPIYAAVRAFNNADNGWGIGILIGMFFPLVGIILAVVYLGQQGSRPRY
ncbi:MAG TPA: hypothetical protein VHC63_16935 [Acidimicrobiales bacterium]|nr:hypothetical protein [Acidimicrobiales bacterium]